MYWSEETSVCREAAARCREVTLTSTDPAMWTRMAAEWDWLANTSEGTRLLALALTELESDKINGSPL